MINQLNWLTNWIDILTFSMFKRSRRVSSNGEFSTGADKVDIVMAARIITTTVIVFIFELLWCLISEHYNGTKTQSLMNNEISKVININKSNRCLRKYKAPPWPRNCFSAVNEVKHEHKYPHFFPFRKSLYSRPILSPKSPWHFFWKICISKPPVWEKF